MATPTQKVMNDFVQQRIRSGPSDYYNMLGAWVSELEPVPVVYLPGCVEGIAAANFVHDNVVSEKHMTIRRSDVFGPRSK